MACNERDKFYKCCCSRCLETRVICGKCCKCVPRRWCMEIKNVGGEEETVYHREIFSSQLVGPTIPGDFTDSQGLTKFYDKTWFGRFACPNYISVDPPLLVVSDVVTVRIGLLHDPEHPPEVGQEAPEHGCWWRVWANCECAQDDIDPDDIILDEWIPVDEKKQDCRDYRNSDTGESATGFTLGPFTIELESCTVEITIRPSWRMTQLHYFDAEQTEPNEETDDKGCKKRYCGQCLCVHRELCVQLWDLETPDENGFFNYEARTYYWRRADSPDADDPYWWQWIDDDTKEFKEDEDAIIALLAYDGPNRECILWPSYNPEDPDFWKWQPPPRLWTNDPAVAVEEAGNYDVVLVDQFRCIKADRFYWAGLSEDETQFIVIIPKDCECDQAQTCCPNPIPDEVGVTVRYGHSAAAGFPEDVVVEVDVQAVWTPGEATPNNSIFPRYIGFFDNPRPDLLDFVSRFIVEIFCGHAVYITAEISAAKTIGGQDLFPGDYIPCMWGGCSYGDAHPDIMGVGTDLGWANKWSNQHGVTIFSLSELAPGSVCECDPFMMFAECYTLALFQGNINDVLVFG